MICEACRDRNFECSYREGEPKGRPKSLSVTTPYTAAKTTDDTSTANGIPPKDTVTNAIYNTHSNMRASSFSSSDRPGTAKGLRLEHVSVAAKLQNVFSRLTSSSAGPAMDRLDMKIDLFREHMSAHSSVLVDTSVPTSLSNDLSYEDIFFSISQELIEMLALRLGEIGCRQLDLSRSRYFLKSYTIDTATTMFDSSDWPMDPIQQARTLASVPEDIMPRVRSPLQAYDSHQVVQMHEVWFSQHPFSFMFSKTLLLRDIRQDTHDDILAAVMLADVLAAQGTDEARANSHDMYTWASIRLGAVRQDDLRLSTIQAVVLLGWHALCLGQARRALCLLFWADSTVRSLPAIKLGVNIINGIDVGKVEAENLCSTHWLTFSISVWIVMQTKVPGRDSPPWDVPDALPPPDRTMLNTFNLDRASYNFSTLQSQEGTYCELWLLSHVAAFTSHIYALCPRILPPRMETVKPAESWQSHILTHLRNLADPMEDILILCTQARHVLLDLVQTLESHVQHTHSQALTLSIAHTIMIHLLLPSSESSSSGTNSLGARRVLAAGGIHRLFSDFRSSLTALLKVFGVLKNTTQLMPARNRITMSQRASTNDAIMYLALDACGRGLKSLWTLGRSGTETERHFLKEKTDELLAVATDLHAFSKKLDSVSPANMGGVTEQLENVICQFMSLQYEDNEERWLGTTPPSDMELMLPSHDFGDMRMDDMGTKLMEHDMMNGFMPMLPVDCVTNDW